MGQHPEPSAFEARSNATFSALMWALSRPGLPQMMPAAGQGGVIEALLDRECAAFCDTPAMAELAAGTGAAVVPVQSADHVFFEALPGVEVLAEINMGSDLYPDDGATLVCGARLGQGALLRLTGPGCDGVVEVRVGGLPEGFWQARARLMRYPMGFEVFLIDGAQVLGLPRSCHVEVA